MDLQALEKLLRVGEILAITPSLTTTKKTFGKKCYDVAVLTVFTVGISYSLYNRSTFYTKLNIFKLIIRVLVDLCLCVLSYYILVGVHFRKREWSHLISNLKSVKTSKGNYTRAVIVAHLVYCPIILYTSWLWFRILKVVYFKNFFFELSQFYMFFFYNILIALILKMILSRYDHIKELVTKQNDKFCVLKQCKFDIYRLKESVDVFNDIFGWPLFLIISYSVLRILYSVEAILRDSVRSRISLLVTDIAVISLHLIGTIGVILLCDFISKEAEAILQFCQKHENQNKEMRKMTLITEDILPKFSAARFFDIDRSTIFAILNTLTTFVILMVQFRSLLKEMEEFKTS